MILEDVLKSQFFKILPPPKISKTFLQFFTRCSEKIVRSFSRFSEEEKFWKIGISKHLDSRKFNIAFVSHFGLRFLELWKIPRQNSKQLDSVFRPQRNSQFLTLKKILRWFFFYGLQSCGDLRAHYNSSNMSEEHVIQFNFFLWQPSRKRCVNSWTSK